MSSLVRLASFCRLCLTKTKDKMPIFADGDLLENLLHLIDIQIDPNDEPDAVVCYDCVATLEGFHQFKEQCRANDELVRTVPAKRDCSASSAELVLEEDEEEEDAILEEDDYLELSEAEEVFQERPKQKAAAKFIKKIKVARANFFVSTIKTPEEDETTLPKTLDELQVLAESYPDFFYFEKGARSIYYTMMFYGERYNSALFNETKTYWQCSHRRRYHCPAQVVVTNDYKTFQRRYDHTHGVKRDKEGQVFTPHEALPEIFQICKRIVLQKQARKVELGSEEKVDPATEPESEPRPKRKIKPNLRYAAELKQPKKRNVESKKQHILKDETKKLQAGEKPKSRFAEKCEREMQEEMDASESENYTTEEKEEEEEEELDLDKVTAECEALNIPIKQPRGPSLDEQLVLADSYPDYFFFEKGPRSLYYTLVYYGERYNSAIFGEYFTYWKCAHRGKYKCRAHVSVTNDYKTFERRYEHSHPAHPDKEGEAFTPKEALPELFKTCRRIVLKYRAKRIKKLLDKYKPLKSVKADEPTSEAIVMEEIVEEEILEYNGYEELIEEQID